MTSSYGKPEKAPATKNSMPAMLVIAIVLFVLALVLALGPLLLSGLAHVLIEKGFVTRDRTIWGLFEWAPMLMFVTVPAAGISFLLAIVVMLAGVFTSNRGNGNEAEPNPTVDTDARKNSAHGSP